MKYIARFAGLLFAIALVAKSASLAAADSSGEWVDVTNNVGGEKWGAYGVTYMAAVPGKAEIIAGVSERGLWLTSDGGKTWKQLGGDEIKFRPGCIAFDPKDPATFWVSGCYGDSPFMTSDGGKTFTRLGKLTHSDTIAVDFTDPKRQSLLLGLHEQSQSLQMTTDGGKSWTNLGAKLPADSNHSTDPVILDSKTFLINTAGWKRDASLGIYRTEDAGQTWTKTSDLGPAGRPLVATDGAIYWQRLWGGGLLKSTDQGRTWKQITRTIKDNPVQLPNNGLAGTDGDQLFVSTDGGENWTKVEPKLPFKPSGIIFSAQEQCFYAWRLSDNLKRSTPSIVRLSWKSAGPEQK